MWRKHTLILALLAFLSAGSSTQADPLGSWYLSLSGTGDPWGEKWLGVSPGWSDGYDVGEQAPSTDGLTGGFLRFYKETGPDWSGPSGFYVADIRSPIQEGGSKTWSDMCAWAQNTPLDGSQAWLRVVPDNGLPPEGYRATLAIDYVPPSLTWTGPWSYDFEIGSIQTLLIPVPLADDPLDPNQVARMHIVVYAVPEPSSLLALAGSVFGLGVFRLRRRR